MCELDGEPGTLESGRPADSLEDRTRPESPAQPETRIEVSLVELSDIEHAGQLWTDLQTRSRYSYFISWGWIGCWLNQLPAALRPQLLVARTSDRVVGLGVLNRTWIRHCTLIPSRSLFLHETGNSPCDLLTIEHNGFLVESGQEAVVNRAIVDYLCEACPDWDELFLSGLDTDAPVVSVLQEPRRGVRYRTLKQRSCLMVDLATLRDGGKDFCSTLSSSTRSQVRRSIRLYEAGGAVIVQRAASAAEALQFYEQLKILHRATWESRGLPGAFAEPCVDEFHRRLIETRYSCGEIDLLEFKAGERAIGYLYNFVRDGHVSQYQSGLQYEQDSKLKPGMVCHTLAVEYYRDLGCHTYDFLAGDCQYKQSLGGGDKKMVWGVLQRNRARFRIEDLLRAVRGAWRVARGG